MLVQSRRNSVGAPIINTERLAVFFLSKYLDGFFVLMLRKSVCLATVAVQVL
jgi:hypothetical protein